MRARARANTRGRQFPSFQHDGKASVFTCPDCQGTLFLLQDSGVLRFRCRIGHLYSPESMLEAQDDNVERLMWSACRALEEQAEYVSQMADRIAKAENPRRAQHYVAKSRAALQKADSIRKLLTDDP